MDGVLILAIETATGCGSVAVTMGTVRKGRVLGEILLQPEQVHSRRLLGSIVFLLEGLGLTWTDLEGIGISLGPGSFTGLRIGLAAAKGLVMATGLPLLGVMTLDGVALSCWGASRPLCCLLDARKQEVYCGWYTMDRGRPRRQGDFQALRPAALAAGIHESVMVAGPGVDACGSLLRDHPLVAIRPPALSQPRAARIGLLAAELYGQGNFTDPATAVPFYLRASEAEINGARKRNQERAS